MPLDWPHSQEEERREGPPQEADRQSPETKQEQDPAAKKLMHGPLEIYP